MSNQHLGRIGESTVRKYLEQKGYTFVAQNVRVGHDEIDLIMLDGRVTVFVEVKLRKPGVSGAEAVDLAKRRRISRAAVVYMTKTGGLDRAARSDVAEVVFDGVHAEVHHIPDAFPLVRGRYFV